MNGGGSHKEGEYDAYVLYKKKIVQSFQESRGMGCEGYIGFTNFASLLTDQMAPDKSLEYGKNVLVLYIVWCLTNWTAASTTSTAQHSRKYEKCNLSGRWVLFCRLYLFHDFESTILLMMLSPHLRSLRSK